MDDFYDPIYKGCTAPASVAGVPLIPLILGALAIGQAAVLSFYFIRASVALGFLVIGVVLFVVARKIGTNDEHRLLQYMLKARMRGRQAASRKFWGAVSFSPLRPRK